MPTLGDGTFAAWAGRYGAEAGRRGRTAWAAFYDCIQGFTPSSRASKIWLVMRLNTSYRRVHDDLEETIITALRQLRGKVRKARSRPAGSLY